MTRTFPLLVLAIVPGCGATPAPTPIYLGHVAGTARGASEQETLGIRLAIEELTRAGQEKVGERPIHVKHAETRGEGAMEAQAVRLAAVSRAVALYGGNT